MGGKRESTYCSQDWTRDHATHTYISINQCKADCLANPNCTGISFWIGGSCVICQDEMQYSIHESCETYTKSLDGKRNFTANSCLVYKQDRTCQKFDY